MRHLPSVLAIAIAATLGCSAATAPPPGQLMLVLESNGGLGTSLDFSRVDVVVTDARAGGQIARNYALSPARLPGTVALVAAGPGSEPTKVEVFATDEKGALRIYQAMQVTLPSEGARMLRVKLDTACDGVFPKLACPGGASSCAASPNAVCATEQACLTGRCVPVQDLVAQDLPAFDGARVDSCEPEPEQAICARRGIACGSFVLADTCGTPRIARCGACRAEAAGTTAKLTGAGLDDCGPLGADTCGRSLLVTGGTINRRGEASTPAAVSDFRLDKYEVTVGRFRKFVDAWIGGWRPAPGSGKHAHLNGGAGLADPTDRYEAGWNAAWSAYVGVPDAAADAPTAPGATTLEAWTRALSCDGSFRTWTPSAGANEARPQNCLSWFDSYAFCIWDGGFLPSEAEWEYAASGGSEARTYPWGFAAPTETFASFDVGGARECMGDGEPGCTTADLVFAGSKPAGDGRWGQSELSGNVNEWSLDWYRTPYVTPCVDCALMRAGNGRSMRGGSFNYLGTFLAAIYRKADLAASRGADHGGRCARMP
jgi:sulfatase modifying factor 1